MKATATTLSRPRGSAARHQPGAARADLPGDHQGGGPGRHPAQPRLQRRQPGRHRDEPGDDRRRPPHEHRALLSRPDPQPPEPAYRDRRADRGARARRQALHRRPLFGRRRRRARPRAAREVVVCAGTINSPQLLELSGIGQPERLRDLGIEVRQALPGVGENLRDHYAPRTRWLVGKKGITFNDRGARPRHGPSGDALRAVPQGLAGQRRGADARLRLLARGAGGAGPAARAGCRC